MSDRERLSTTLKKPHLEYIRHLAYLRKCNLNDILEEIIEAYKANKK